MQRQHSIGLTDAGVEAVAQVAQNGFTGDGSDEIADGGEDELEHHEDDDVVEDVLDLCIRV